MPDSVQFVIPQTPKGKSRRMFKYVKETKAERMLRFFSKVRPQSNGCWEFDARDARSGYKQFNIGGVAVMAHRFSKELLSGKIPDGLQVDHLCRNTGCVNPDHLEVVTARTNVLRGNTVTGFNYRKTHCHRGHSLEHARIRPNTNGHRVCRVCERENRRAAAKRKFHNSANAKREVSS